MKRSDIDRAGMLDAGIKSLSDELKELKEKIRDGMEANSTAEGNEFVAVLSKEPEEHEKVDYRSELIAAIGVKKVTALEVEAYAKVTKGTPRLSFRAVVDLKKLAATR